MGMFSAPDTNGAPPNSLNHAAKVVQAKRNAKKRRDFLDIAELQHDLVMRVGSSQYIDGTANEDGLQGEVTNNRKQEN